MSGIEATNADLFFEKLDEEGRRGIISIIIRYPY